MTTERTDESLMVAYQLGDEDAFTVLYRRHSGRVLNFLKLKCRDDALARDVFQSTFLKLHRSRSTYNSSFPFVTWLFTICRSELLDSIRKKARSNETLVDEFPDVAAEEIETGGFSIDTSSLPEKQKVAVDMRFRQDFSFEEIAAKLETSPVNVRKLVSRALKALRMSYGRD
jgi:RNA polymerase sigma factor (sigma-70 family)